MNEIDSIQIKERYELPKRFSQARQQAKYEIDECLREKPGSVAAKYELASLTFLWAVHFVEEYRDRYYEQTEESKKFAFVDCSRFVFYGCRLLLCLDQIGKVTDHRDSSVTTCFHTAGTSAISAVVKFCSEIYEIWAGVLGRDLEYSIVTKEFLEQDFHKPEVIEYILKWRANVHHFLCEILPSEQWPSCKLNQEKERLLSLCEIEYNKIRESDIQPPTESEEHISGESKEQPWDKTDSTYIPNSEAIETYTNSKMNVSTLGRMLTPTGSMRYMRKGHRCRVHIGDFRAYANQIFISDETANEIADEVFAGRKFRKDQIDRRKKKTGK